jgi:hypothetical protein
MWGSIHDVRRRLECYALVTKRLVDTIYVFDLEVNGRAAL